MQPRLVLAALAIAAAAATGGGQPAAAFECPRPEKSGLGVIAQTAQDQQALTKAFSAANIEDEIGVAVSELQQRYPGVSDGELTNYLIGEYCPVVAKMPGLTDAQRTAKVEHFAATVFELLSEQKL